MTPEEQIDLRVSDVLSEVGADMHELSGYLVDAKILDFEALMRLLNEADLALDAMKTNRDALQQLAWRARGKAYGDVDLDGLPVASVRRTANRNQWDHRGAAFALLDARMTEVGGEVVDPATVVDWILEGAGVSYWKKGALTAAGIEVDDYCTKVTGNPKIEFTRTGPNPLLADE